MLIPRFTIRTLLVVLTVCSIVFVFAGIAVRDRLLGRPKLGIASTFHDALAFSPSHAGVLNSCRVNRFFLSGLSSRLRVQCPPGLNDVSLRPDAVMRVVPAVYGKATRPSVLPT